MPASATAPAPVDTDALKRAHPIAEVVARYGIELRPSGRALVGRCPFHADAGRPNLAVYPANASFYCYRCAVGGDVIAFVRRIEQIGFQEACARLGADGRGPLRRHPTAPPRRLPPRRTAPVARHLGAAERACLSAAVELYHNALLGTPAALAYLAGRGITRATVEACRLGYVAGDALPDYLAWRRLPVGAALRIGLLGHGGREPLAGRVVVPELRGGQPVWLVGRTLDPDGDPKYLGLPGRKPLLGWEDAAGSPTALLVEGVFDRLTLRQWGLPALALVGTRIRPEVVEALGARFQRLYLALDNDDAGREATEVLRAALGAQRVVPVAVPDGVKDVAELAPRPDGNALFAAALLRAAEAAGIAPPSAAA